MCLNGWGGALHAVLLPYLAEAAPDILCLQEVVDTPGAQKDVLTYRDVDRALPQHANLFREVTRAFPEHVATFCPASRSVLWDGDVSVPSYWGLATFVHRSLPVIGQIQGFVHKGFSPDGYGEHPRARSAHGIRVFDPRTGRTVSVTQTHGLWDPRGKIDTPEREAQAHRLIEISRHLSHPEDQVVVCGDLNVVPGSRTLEILTEAGLTELVGLGGHPGTRSSFYKKPGQFADYMLVDDPSAVRQFRVIRDPEVSDHCPLLLEI